MKNFFTKAIIKSLDKIHLLNLFWKHPGFFKINPGYIFLSPEDKLSAWYRRYDIWEPPVSKFIEQKIKKGTKILEFGSCMGYFSLYLARKVGDSGKVAGIEPFPRYFRLLELTKKKNNFKNLNFFNFGISNKNEKIIFEEDFSPHSMYENLNRVEYENSKNKLNKKKISVDAYTLKDIIKKIGFKPNLIFMDIEGAELTVFDQLFKLKLYPDVFFEVHHQYYGDKKLNDYLKVFSKEGYKIEKVDHDHLFLYK